MRKVLIITNDVEMGGIQKSLIDFLGYLSQKELEIDLLLWQNNGVLKNQIPSSVRIIEKKYSKTWIDIKKEENYWHKLLFSYQYFVFIFYSKVVNKPWRFFSKTKETYDVAIAYNQNGFPLFYAIDRVSANKKYLWYHHGSYESTREVYELDKKYYNTFDRLVTVSSANKEMLSTYFSALQNKISVIPNIINVEKIIHDSKVLLSDFLKIEGVYIFVTVSRFSKEKGIELALDIAEELKNRNLKFKWYFIGDGDLFNEIKQSVLERDLEEFCILLGMKTNPYPYIKMADLYLQTSFVESQSITIYEALVLKKMIITTNIPALNDALQNGTLGILCKPEKKSFAHEIFNLLNNPEAKRKLAIELENHVVSNDYAFEGIDELLEIK